MRHGITALLAGTLFVVAADPEGPIRPRNNRLRRPRLQPRQHSGRPGGSPEQAKVSLRQPPRRGASKRSGRSSASYQAPAAVPVEPPKPPQPKTYTIATGTSIAVRTLELSTLSTQNGKRVETTLVDSLLLTVIPGQTGRDGYRYRRQRGSGRPR